MAIIEAITGIIMDATKAAAIIEATISAVITDTIDLLTAGTMVITGNPVIMGTTLNADLRVRKVITVLMACDLRSTGHTGKDPMGKGRKDMVPTDLDLPSPARFSSTSIKTRTAS